MTLASGLDAGASAGAHALARYRSEFPIFRDAVYLNTCSLGALGERTRRRVAEFFDLWQARGASAWPMIVFASPKGWTGPKEVDGKKAEGSWRSHQVPLANIRGNDEHLKALETW